jgi:hypothetical protein
MLTEKNINEVIKLLSSGDIWRISKKKFESFLKCLKSKNFINIYIKFWILIFKQLFYFLNYEIIDRTDFLVISNLWEKYIIEYRKSNHKEIHKEYVYYFAENEFKDTEKNLEEKKIFYKWISKLADKTNKLPEIAKYKLEDGRKESFSLEYFLKQINSDTKTLLKSIKIGADEELFQKFRYQITEYIAQNYKINNKTPKIEKDLFDFLKSCKDRLEKLYEKPGHKHNPLLCQRDWFRESLNKLKEGNNE